MITDFIKKEIRCKVVYYGVGRGGKTTNCFYLDQMIEPERKSAMVALNTEGDPTIYFDFFMASVESIKGFRLKIQVFTVPGQSHYEGLRQQVLRGADAVVMVADSQEELLQENLNSRLELAEFLKINKLDINTIPYVLQLNKRDLPNIASVSEMTEVLQFKGEPVIEAIAINGEGVQKTLDTIIELIVDQAIRVMNG